MLVDFQRLIFGAESGNSERNQKAIEADFRSGPTDIQ
jgi:hypothetical protein